ncbi:phosphoenolpyruvate carboxykinase (ATP), partial [bacterium]|nr:phosphoenolpyruvate carboxykinase (ATP) [bacterium]
PAVYSELFREKMARHDVACWLVNTGWSGGRFGVGSRIRIDHTRAMISAALEGGFDSIPFVTEPCFGLSIPCACPGVPSEILAPRTVWPDKNSYDETAGMLVENFKCNFKQFEGLVEDKITAVLSLTKRM